MNTKFKQFSRILVILVALALLSAACQASPQRESKPSADWSRSVAVGSYVKGSIGISVDGDGQFVHMVWPANVGEGIYLRYVTLDAQATPILEKNLEFPGLLRAPRLVADGVGRLHLLWGSRTPGEQNWAIWHVILDENGEPNGSPTQVSQPEVSVSNYQVTSDQNGGVLLCWDSGTQHPIYIQHLDPSGAPLGEPVIITDQGGSASMWLDTNDTVHLAWQESGSLMYAQATLQTLQPSGKIIFGDIPQGTGKSVDGPYVSAAGGWVYVFWSVLNQSGLEAGTGFTAYTAFPASAPAYAEANRLLLSPDEDQPYAAYQGSFQFTQLVPPVQQAWASTDFILSPTMMQGNQPGEIAIALSINQAMRLDQHLQIAVAVFRDGKFAGYSLGTKTENLSDEPALFIDTANHLHLAWREGAAGTHVYYATTQPEAVAALERLNTGDVLNAIFQGGMEGLVGITFLPIIGFGWLLPGMIVIVIVKLFRDDDNLTDWKYWIPLVIAILIYYVVKFATLPTISSYVPFSAWLDIPTRFWSVLQISIPLLIILTATLAANYVRKRKSQSAAVFYITYVLVDALLSLAIYGVNFLGVY